jgi:hypothetical protein
MIHLRFYGFSITGEYGIFHSISSRLIKLIMNSYMNPGLKRKVIK